MRHCDLIGREERVRVTDGRVGVLRTYVLGAHFSVISGILPACAEYSVLV